MAQIIYIAGYGRSGSTVLDVLLGNHEQIASLGEFRNYFDDHYQGTGVLCSCGKSLGDACCFWRDVKTEFDESSPALSAAEALRITSIVESISGNISRKGSLTDEPAREYGRLWRTLFDAVEKVSGRSYLVDSSKTAYPSAFRIWALQRLCHLDLRIIHLVRDPRGVIWSTMKGDNKQTHLDLPRRFPLLRAAIGWLFSNLIVAPTAKSLSAPMLRIRYEDLMQDPAGTFDDIGEFLGLDFSTIVEKINEQGAFDTGHGLAGNRTRHGGRLKLKHQPDWAGRLSPRATAMALLVWPIASLYGYELR